MAKNNRAIMAQSSPSSSASSSSSEDENCLEVHGSKGNSGGRSIDTSVNRKKKLWTDQNDDHDDNDDNGGAVTINTKYATEYTTRKQHEELTNYYKEERRTGSGRSQRTKNTTIRKKSSHADGMEKENIIVDDNDDNNDDEYEDNSLTDTSSESEDEDADLLTPILDLKILQTIQALRKKDDRIYDSKVNFFSTHNELTTNNDTNMSFQLSSSSSSSLPLYENDKNHHKVMRIKDVMREQIVQQMEKAEEDDNSDINTETDKDVDDDDDAGERGRNGLFFNEEHGSNHKLRFVYDEEQRQIRKDFLSSVACQSTKNDANLASTTFTSTTATNDNNQENSHEEETTKIDQDEGEEDDDNLLVVKRKGHSQSTKYEGQDHSNNIQSAIKEMIMMDSYKDAENGAAFRNCDLPNDTIISDPHGEIKNGEEFLRDFILHRRWVDTTANTTTTSIGAVNNVNLQQDDMNSDDEGDGYGAKLRARNRVDIHSNRNMQRRNDGDYDDGVNDHESASSSSLEDMDLMDSFESKYNFRFEEAAAAAAADADADAENKVGSAANTRYQIVGYARGSLASNTLRRKDEARKDKRLVRKERKLAKRKAKEEELRRLKNARRQDLKEKLEQIKSVSGLMADDDLGKNTKLSEETLAKLLYGDFDADKFSQIMEQELYGEEDFYQKEDEGWKSEKDIKQSMKQTAIGGRDDDSDDYDDVYIDGEVDDYVDHVDGYDEDAHVDGSMYNQDKDERTNPGVTSPLENGDERKLTEVEKQIKDKMADELYKLDYEDLIGDMPCRFKYRNVEPNNYGLDCREILFPDDRTLRQFVSLKKMAPYRDEMEHHVGPKKRKRFRQMLKEEMSTNAHVGQEKYVVVDKSKSSDTVKGSKESTNTEESIEGTKKKRRRQKKGKKLSKQDSVKLVEPTVVVDEGNVSPFKSQIEESENVELVTSANGDDNTSRRREKTTKKENHALGTADVELRKSVIVPDPIGVSTNADDDAGCLLKFVGQQSTSDGKNRILNKKEKANRAGSKRRRAKKGGISVSRLSSYGL